MQTSQNQKVWNQVGEWNSMVAIKQQLFLEVSAFPILTAIVPNTINKQSCRIDPQD